MAKKYKKINKKALKNNKQHVCGTRTSKKRINHDVLFDFSIHQVKIKESQEKNCCVQDARKVSCSKKVTVMADFVYF